MTTKPYILIVEDDKSYGRVFKRKLEHEGMEAEWAENGELGLEMIQKRLPDVLILDLMMPKLDGYGVLEAINKQGLKDKIKIIVATNLSQEIDVERAKENGADDYFVKSNLSVSEMIERVKKHL